MSTLADIGLLVARRLTTVSQGAATAGSTTSLTDATNLVEDDGYWDGSTLFFLTPGANAGLVKNVTTHAAGVLNWSGALSAVVAGDAYAVARKYAIVGREITWQRLVGGINAALGAIYVPGDNSSLTGDGSTLSFTLPAGVQRVYAVMWEQSAKRSPSYHWSESGGKLIFEDGHAPSSSDTIHIFYRKRPAVLKAAADTIDPAVNELWLAARSAFEVLMWAKSLYGEDDVTEITTLLQTIAGELQGLAPMTQAFGEYHSAGISG